MKVNQMKFAIAIPTYNRLNNLKRAIEHIENQVFDSNVELYCVISNTASTDGTHDYLMNLKSKTIKYVIHSSKEKSIYINFYKLASIMPPDIDWVWWHGDDDFLSSKTSIQEIVSSINSTQNLSFIHACQTRRSKNSGNVLSGSLLDLCNSVGYHEILGWMSSIVMRSDRWVEAIKKSSLYGTKFDSSEQFIEHKISCFTHSSAILELCSDDKAIFIDKPLVEPQDLEQTKTSIERWTVEKVGERYFFVVDDLLQLKEKGILKEGVTRHFFRYLTYNLWDRYATYIIEHLLLNKGMYPELLDHFNRIKEISVLFESSSDVKSYLLWWYSLESEIKNYQKCLQLMNESIGSMERLLGISNVANYDFQTLDHKGQVQN